MIMRKKTTKRIILIASLVFLVVGAFSIMIDNLIKPVSAQDDSSLINDPREYKLRVPIGDLQKLELEDEPGEQECKHYKGGKCYQIPWIAQYIQAWYKYALVIGSILAVVSFIVGGAMYIFGGMSQSMVTRAKELIIGSLSGLLLLLGSYTLLHTINPNLVDLTPIEIPVLKGMLQPPEFCEDINSEDYKHHKYFVFTARESDGKTFPVGNHLWARISF